MSQLNQAKPFTAASSARRRANRRNGKKSTGPRSVAGKRRSSLNAVTHGIFCQDAVLPGEDGRAFVVFRNLLLDSPGLRPQSALELSIADQYVLAKWKLRRTLAAEQVVHGSIAESLAEVARLPADDLVELLHNREMLMRLDARDDGFSDPLKKLKNLPHDDDDDDEEALAAARLAEVEAMVGPIVEMTGAMAGANQLPPAATLAASFTTKQHDGAFERVGRYQHRMELSADRALRELRQLRKDLGVDVASLPTCPFLEPVPEEAEEDDEVESASSPDSGHTPTRTRTRTPPPPTPSGEDGDRVTEVTPPARRGASSDAPVQNEANPASSCVAPGIDKACAQGACDIELVTPTKFGRGGARGTGRDETEEADRT